MDPVAGVLGLVGGAVVTYVLCVCLMWREPRSAEQKVEIAELGENDILVLTTEKQISQELEARIRARFDERLKESGRVVLVLDGGFKLSVVRRTWAPPKSPPPAHAIVRSRHRKQGRPAA